MFIIRGEFAKIEEFRKTLKWAPRRLLPTISRNCAEESVTLASAAFKQGRSPYGAFWPPRKSGRGGRALLVRTGALRNSIGVLSATVRAFTIAYTMAYAVYHQFGTKRMPRRQLLPSKGHLPPGWLSAYFEIADEVMGGYWK